jgi:hypothetical protein
MDKTVNIKNDWLRFWKCEAGACIMINLNFGDYLLTTFFDFVIVIDIGTSSM